MLGGISGSWALSLPEAVGLIPGARSRLLTWGWEQEAAAVVLGAICTVSPPITHPLQVAAPTVLAEELSGPTGVCRHKGHGSTQGRASPPLPSPCLDQVQSPHPLTQEHLLSVAFKAR